MAEATRLILLVEDDPDHEMLTIRALKKSNIANDASRSRETAKKPSTYCLAPVQFGRSWCCLISNCRRWKAWKCSAAYAKTKARACCRWLCSLPQTKSGMSCAATNLV